MSRKSVRLDFFVGVIITGIFYLELGGTVEFINLLPGIYLELGGSG